MYKKVLATSITKTTLTAAAVAILSAGKVSAQMSLSGQIRPRAELRDGFSNLTPTTASPGSFISQRTRLIFGYKWDRLTFGATVQDVRVWGQDASTISPADGNRLMLHEGWADIVLANKADTTIKFKLVDNLSFKVGRQELIYDDARLIGNLDWLQQGRRFDMALLKIVHHGWQVDLGYAYNQNAENNAGTLYTPGNVPQYIRDSNGELVTTPAGVVPLTAGGSISANSSATGTPAYSNPANSNAGNQNYKNFVSLYIAKKLNQTKLSLLFFKDDFGKYTTTATPTTNGGFVYGRAFNQKGTNNRYTLGGMISPTFGNASGFGKIAAQAAYYQQMGEDRDGKDLNAFHYTAAATYSKGKFTAGPGFDFLSGNKTTTDANESKRFDPLYGTPHKFWGFMDFFYAPSGSPTAGLKDYYFKTKFTANEYSIAADFHRFDADHSPAAGATKHYAHEIDVITSYTLNKFTTIDLGYSHAWATSSLPLAKGLTTTGLDKSPDFAYLMINIKPDFLFTKPVAIKQ
ncbi:alginate export family protein [Desertivirga arenae]|uniref:alginate export family protein n=1 Tax=Desertivirga arenae TaxID=2810309 RepID=UPI001A96278F|nr:alginate export family protein [Pedobacter sp. SYSU D00823]